MIGWLWRVVVGRFSRCEHHWSVLNEIKVFEDSARPVAREYHLQCDLCGHLKRRTFSS